MHVLCVAAARPNFMKVAPVVRALEARDVDITIVHTGQHHDASMSDVFFADLGLRQPDHHLGVRGGSNDEQIGRLVPVMAELTRSLDPDAVVVVGDVNATMAAALAAARTRSLVAHVEAGLRSRDWEMPEELNRVVTDRVSDLLLAPSEDAVENLRAEGVAEERIHLVGNVMVDSLLESLPRARERRVVDDLGLAGGPYGVVTLHRPANVDDGRALVHLLSVLADVAERCPLVFPVHPRTRAALPASALPPSLKLVEPIGYLDFLALQSTAAVVLTDSGGIQEETTVLGVPCVTLRTTTERPITVTEGTNTVVGTDREAVLAAVDRALAGQVPKRKPALWDGRAGERIADVLLRSRDLPKRLSGVRD